MITLMTNLFDDVMDRADVDFLCPGRTRHAIEVHDCDCCGVATPDVDLWAEDCETGEELWLCGACSEW